MNILNNPWASIQQQADYVTNKYGLSDAKRLYPDLFMTGREPVYIPQDIYVTPNVQQPVQQNGNFDFLKALQNILADKFNSKQDIGNGVSGSW